MSDKDQMKDNPTPEITRRATFKLATAVAAFGAALGMRATSARAEGKVGTKGVIERKGEHIAKQTKREGHWVDKSTKRDSGNNEGGGGYIKLKKDDKN